jgi:hypothetical protein
MPHPKNGLKLTGDTRMPELGDLPGDADEIEVTVVEVATPERVYADGWVPTEPLLAQAQSHHKLPAPLMKVERKVERRVAATPWLAMGVALGFGFLVAKMLRR